MNDLLEIFMKMNVAEKFELVLKVNDEKSIVEKNKTAIPPAKFSYCLTTKECHHEIL